MSLGKSLARSKAKFKKQPRSSSRNTSLAPSSLDLPNTSSDTLSGLTQTHIPTTNAPPSPVLIDTNNEPAVSTTSEINHPSRTASTAWAGAKTLLAILESSANAFGPLKSAISRLNRCFDIHERANKGQEDYEELLKKLKELVDDLRGSMVEQVGYEMTNSVKRLCIELEAEVNQVEKKLERNMIQQLVEAMDASEEISECYRRIQNHLERLTLNATMNVIKKLNNQGEAIDQQVEAIEQQTKLLNKQEMESRLKGMSLAMSAIYNSAESDDIGRVGCAPGTRQAQIDLLLNWTRDPKAGKTCWMNGMAGTGKTTIAYSVCSQLTEFFGLGASFFCTRVISECRQVKYIIPSIAYQLARFSLPFRCALDKALECDPDAHTRALKLQYEKLIVKPILSVLDSLPTDFIVVIDALDECENENSLSQILDLILSTPSVLPIRFLVSSRPEPEIYRRMMGRQNEQGATRLVLHDLNATDVKSDIRTYMRRELQHVPLTNAQWSSLIERCGVLFIYAATTCRYIDEGHKAESLEDAVNTILRSASVPMEAGDERPIDELYSTILDAAFQRSKRRLEDKRRMKDVLETVICAQEPMTLDDLAGVLGLQGAKQVEAVLQPLRSVLNITSTNGLVTTLHASFPDFMLSLGRSRAFHCVASSRNATLAERCLQIIDAVEPKFNIGGLSSSFLPDDKVEDLDKRVAKKISPILIYSCRYWSTHLYLGEARRELVIIVLKFFSENLLIWMEILNLTKRIRFGTSIIRDAERWCQNGIVPSDLVKLVRDAGQLVSVYANHPTSRSTPHIYVSMLAFWPRSRPVSVAYTPRTVGILEPTGKVITRRQPALLATWEMSGGIVSISLSSDGRRIAVATISGVDLLDTATGDRVFHIKRPQIRRLRAIAVSPDGAQIAFGGNSPVCLLDAQGETLQAPTQPSSIVLSVAFSPDGCWLAVGLANGNIHICAPQNNDLVLEPLQGHTGNVNSVVFSPDGLHLASGSDDKCIRVWDVKAGRMVGNPLRGHTGYVFSVSYSPDGSCLASGSADETIRVWSPLKGLTLLGPLNDHSDFVCSVAFSPNGSFIASGSDDKTVRVYDAQTGQTVLGPLEGHTGLVKSVVFSSDSLQLFSCSDDGTIRLWSIQDLDISVSSRSNFPKHFLSVRYSPDGSQTVSGSSDGSVCVWDVQTEEMVLGPLHGHTDPVWAVDYSPNNAYIASASADSTVRIWSAQDGRDVHGPMEGHTGNVYCVRFSPDSSLLASGSFNKDVRIWDVTSGQSVIGPLQGHTRPVYSVAFSPNGALVVSGSYDTTIRVWDIETSQTVVGPLQGHEDRVSSVEFSPDGSKILSGSWDGSTRVWDAQTGHKLLSCSDNQDHIYSVSFSPNGLLIASGSNDNTTRIWDAQSGRLILKLEGHSNWVRSVQFSPDGWYVVSCSDDSTIRFWDVSSRITKPKLNSSEGLGNAHMPTDMFDSRYLNSNGWLVDRLQRQLVWVPDDLRMVVPQYPNDHVICRQGSLKLDFDGVYIGEQWLDCYRL
ncbi:unnamed protein product [Rhizoctonia solani]|uniref:Vegetative incompatibility protein HET-E-1 n=1 Tax=Rhizoctonia solani TaxID=456999 RepID=A0A8H3BSU0_9AGAM|nr:unnamed protein product [Rhizoctonia solani]CAE6464722.1 unnamed protein product [Rhizoctonia solani]